jgi:hypothetical protein
MTKSKYLLFLLFLTIQVSSSFGHYFDSSDFLLSPGGKIKVYENFPLNFTNPNIERAIIFIHGVARNADEYFKDVIDASALEKLENKTLILVPHFKIDSDTKESDELYWTDSWKFGDKSAKNGMSSYEVIDRIIENIWLKGHFPNLRKIIVVGHSAGGQFVARYAAGSPVVDRFSIQVSYVIANPSAYLYFNDKRTDGNKGFITPDNSCPDFNVYPYGVEQMNSYMGHVSTYELSNRFNHRNVTLLLGEADTLDDYLDTSCEANLQGKNRLERGLNYYQFIKTFYPDSRLKLKTVPNVGHSGREIIQSQMGRELLFH